MSRLVVGTVQWGMRYGMANRSGIPDESTVAQMLAAAWDGGVRTLDTAQAYGTAEEVIGRSTRHAWEIITKLHPDVMSADGVRPAIVGSLRRLNRDRIDVLLVHNPNQRGAPGVWQSLTDARDEGLVGSLGVSVFSIDQAPTEATTTPVVQVPGSLFDRRLLKLGLTGIEGLRLLIRSVLLQGIAAMHPEELPAFLSSLREPVGMLGRLAGELGTTPADLMLRYARDRFQGVDVLVGVETEEQMALNLSSWHSPGLSDHLLSKLEEIASSIPQTDEVLNPACWPR